MSLPDPKQSAGAAILTAILGAAFVTAWALYLLLFARTLLRRPNDLLPLMLMGLGLALLWVVYLTVIDSTRD